MLVAGVLGLIGAGWLGWKVNDRIEARRSLRTRATLRALPPPATGPTAETHQVARTPPTPGLPEPAGVAPAEPPRATSHAADTAATKVVTQADTDLIDSLADFFDAPPPVVEAITKAVPLIAPQPPGPVAPAETLSIPDTTPAPSDGPYPFDSIARRDPRRLSVLRWDTQARLRDGGWEKHYDRLCSGLYPALEKTTATDGARRYDEAWESPYFALGMTQADFIRQVTAPTLRSLAEDAHTRSFLAELLEDAPRMELFLSNLKPEDKPGPAIRVWAALSKDDPPELRGKFPELQVATALVFDQEFAFTRPRDPESIRHVIDPLERYRFFREHSRQQHLEADVKRLEVHELVWVVSAAATHDELEWALKEKALRGLRLVNADQAADWSKAYAMIRDTSKPGVARTPPGGRPRKPVDQSKTHGTLAEIFEAGGGDSADQARFATLTAQAYGIPATTLTGEGNSGKHAWFAYLLPSHRWNMGNAFRPFGEPADLPGTGRDADGYANGLTVDPQTGKIIGEFEVQLTGDPQRRMRNRYGQAFRLRLAARVYQANADQGGRYDCLRFATHAARLSIDAWKEAAACLEDQGHKVSFTRWAEFLRDMRVAFDVEDEDKRWPDMIAIADGLAEKHLWIAPYMDAAMILKEHRHSYDVLMREKARRPGDAMIRTRYDLIAVAARRTSEQLAKDVSPKGQENRYFFLRHALRDNLEHLPTFVRMLETFHLAIKGDPRKEQDFLQEIRVTYQNAMRAAGDDVPRMKAVMALIDAVFPYFEKCGRADLGLAVTREKRRFEKMIERALGK